MWRVSNIMCFYLFFYGFRRIVFSVNFTIIYCNPIPWRKFWCSFVIIEMFFVWNRERAISFVIIVIKIIRLNTDEVLVLPSSFRCRLLSCRCCCCCWRWRWRCRCCCGEVFFLLVHRSEYLIYLLCHSDECRALWQFLQFAVIKEN